MTWLRRSSLLFISNRSNNQSSSSKGMTLTTNTSLNKNLNDGGSTSDSTNPNYPSTGKSASRPLKTKRSTSSGSRESASKRKNSIKGGRKGLFRRLWPKRKKRARSAASRRIVVATAMADDSMLIADDEEGTVVTKDITHSTHSTTPSSCSSSTTVSRRLVYMDLSPSSVGQHECLLSDISATDDDEDRSDFDLLFQSRNYVNMHDPQRSRQEEREACKKNNDENTPPKLLQLKRSLVRELTYALPHNTSTASYQRRRTSATSSESDSTFSSFSASGGESELFSMRKTGELAAIPDNSNHSISTDFASANHDSNNQRRNSNTDKNDPTGDTNNFNLNSIRMRLERRTAVSSEETCHLATLSSPSASSIDHIPQSREEKSPIPAPPTQHTSAPLPRASTPPSTTQNQTQAGKTAAIAPAAEEETFNPLIGLYSRDLSYSEENGLNATPLPSDLSIDDAESTNLGGRGNDSPIQAKNKDGHYKRLTSSDIRDGDKIMNNSHNTPPPSVIGSSCTSSISYKHLDEDKSHTSGDSSYYITNIDAKLDHRNDASSDNSNSEEATISSFSAGMTHLEELYSDIIGGMSQFYSSDSGLSILDGGKVTPSYSIDSDSSTSGLLKDDKSCHSSVVSFDSAEFVEDEQHSQQQQLFVDYHQEVITMKSSTASCSISMHDITTIHEEEENEEDILEVMQASSSLQSQPHLLNGELHIMRQELLSQGTTNSGTFSSVTDDSYRHMSYDSLSLTSERGNSPQRSLFGHKNDLSANLEDHGNLIHPITQQPLNNDPNEFITLSSSNTSALTDSACSYDSFSSRSVEYMLGILKEEKKELQKSNLHSESVKYMVHTLKEETERRRSKIKGRLAL